MTFYLSIPFNRFEKSIDFVREQGFQPEIRMANVNFLMCLTEQELVRLRKIVDDNSFSPFTHGPFFGLDVASLDSNISEYSIRCLIHGIKATSALGGSLMVIHTGYLPQFSRGGRRHWFKNWSERMPYIMEKAGESGVTIALENTWDDRPEILLYLASLLEGGEVKFCLDTGHVNAFSRIPLRKWLEGIGDRLVAVHIHDNDGLSDDHLVPGRGTFDFPEFVSFLKTLDPMPFLDLEVDMPRAEASRDYLEKIFQGRVDRVQADLWSSFRSIY